MFKKILLMVGVILTFSLSLAIADDKITLKKMWARATMGTASTGVIYGIFENNTNKDDELIAVSTPVARITNIHRTTMNNEGIMTMREMEKVVLKKGTFVMMETGDIHIMLMGLEQKLTAGYEIPVKFEFKNSPAQNVRVPIYPISVKWKDIK